MRRKIGLAFMVIGVMLLLAALALFLYNEYEDKKAGENAEKYLKKVKKNIDEYRMEQEQNPVITPSTEIPNEWRPDSEQEDPAPKEMKVVEFDGIGYIGYLSIPSLDLELPVISDWNYDNLKISPCRYQGSTYTGDLVIAAHNYPKHFNPLHGIDQGSKVQFIDMEGNIYNYTVHSLETIQPTNIEDMIESPYELTLFTCTYGGQARFAVRCKLVKE